MSKELLAGVVNEQQMKIYAEETAKLQADYDRLKEKYDKLYIDYIELKRELRNELYRKDK